MSAPLLGLALQGFGPQAATTLDSVFAYAALALLVGMVFWNSHNTPDPPRQ